MTDLSAQFAASAGGAVDIDLDQHRLTPHGMMRIARSAAASHGRARVTFRNCSGVFPQTRYDVANAARGRVVFAD